MSLDEEDKVTTPQVKAPTAEEILAAVAELATDYAYVHAFDDKGGFFPLWSVGGFEEITGYTPEELWELGGWATLILEEDHPAIHAYLGRLLQGQTSTVLARLRTKSGEIRWIRDTGRPRYDQESGEIIGTHGIARDVTEEQQALQDLAASEQRLRAQERELSLTLDATTDGIWKWDLTTGELSFSPRWYTMLGYEPHVFPASFEAWAERLHPEDKPQALATARHYLEQRPPTYHSEFRLRCQDGSYRWIRSLARGVDHDDQGRATRLIGHHHDITEERRAHEVLQAELERTAVLADDSAALFGAARGILLQDDFQQMARMLFDAARRLTGAPAGYVAMLTEDGTENEVILLEQGDEDCSVDPDLPMPVRGLRERAYARNQPVWENDFSHSPWQELLPPGHVRLESALFAPLVLDGEAVGLLGLANKPDGFTDRDATVASTLAELASAALQRAHSKAALSESERRYAQLFEAIQSGVAVYRPAPEGDDFVLVDLNAQGEHITQLKRAEVLGRPLDECFPGARPMGMHGCLRQALDTGEYVFLPMSHYGDERLELYVENHIYPMGEDEVIAVFVDATETKRLEEEQQELEQRLHRAQRMEAVGRLAGGVAHDFNNLLTVMQGNIDLALERMWPADPLTELLQETQSSAERAGRLTSQLLTFSRHKVLEARVLSLHDLLQGLHRMLGRLLGEDILLALELEAEADLVLADGGQLEQVVVNMALNARDAMPEGGSLRIATATAAELGLWLIVSDTGCGMLPEVADRIFEPFFTTKEEGQGSGLGLATAFGIIQRHGGRIEVESEPDVGTRFLVWLPLVEEDETDAEEDKRSAPGLARGEELVLVVEDDATVRRVARRILERAGYRVIEAPDGPTALSLASVHPDLALLLTDAVMPGMSGQELASRLVELHPEVKVLLSSGHSPESLHRRGILQSPHFLPKPYKPRELAAKVREVLDS